MKKILLFLSALIALASSAVAQPAGVTTFLQGGPVAMPAASTNVITVGTNSQYFGAPGTSTNLFYPVYEFDNVALTYSVAGFDSTTNGTIAIRVFKSFDNAHTFEPTPSESFGVTDLGAATWQVTTNLSVPGATHIAFVLENGCAGPLTNVLLSINLKSPKRGARPREQ
jgi:hypothetical protein